MKENESPAPRRAAVSMRRRVVPFPLRRAILASLALLAGSGAALAAAPQTESLVGLPGYVDLDQLGLYDSDHASLEISVQAPLLKLLAAAVGEDDSDFAQLLRALKSIRVQSFPITPGDEDRIRARSADIVRKLEQDGWERIVRVRENEEEIHIHLRLEGEQIAGMMVLAVEPGESVTLVNIVGDFDPEQLGRLGHSLNIESLEDLGVSVSRPRAEEEP